MALGLDVSIRNAMLDEITARMGPNALLRIYSGTRPATGAALAGNTLLAELVLNNPAAPAATGGVLTLNAITADSSANATGTATWFRIVQGDGTTFVLDGDVGTSGADLNLNTVSIVAGGPVNITSFTITAPNA